MDGWHNHDISTKDPIIPQLAIVRNFLMDHLIVSHCMTLEITAIMIRSLTAAFRCWRYCTQDGAAVMKHNEKTTTKHTHPGTYSCPIQILNTIGYGSDTFILRHSWAEISMSPRPCQYTGLFTISWLFWYLGDRDASVFRFINNLCRGIAALCSLLVPVYLLILWFTPHIQQCALWQMCSFHIPTYTWISDSWKTVYHFYSQLYSVNAINMLL